MRIVSSVVIMLLSLAMVMGPSLAQSNIESVPLAVIAHGVTPNPDGDVAWRVRPRRAPLPERGKGIVRPASFVLAEGGPLAIVALSGKVQARLAPGEAVWLPPGLPAAVVSLEALPVGYVQIELAPTAELSGADWELATDAFALPRGDEAFDLKLARGVVRLRDATTVDAGIAPGLLYVTSGVLGVEDADGVRVQLTAGSVLEVADEVQLFGASRQPATFVLASVAATVPAELPLLNGVEPTVAPVTTVTTVAPTATPISTATSLPRPTIAPIATSTAAPIPTVVPTPTMAPAGDANVAVTAAICPVVYAGNDYQADCLSPASDVEFTLSRGEELVRSERADADGEVMFGDVPAGDYVIAAAVPGDFASSRVRCIDATGVDIARRAATNQIAVSLVPDDAIACDWFIVPDDARGEVDSPALTIEILGCPATIDPMADGAACDPAPVGTDLSLEMNGETIDPITSETSTWTWESLDAGEYALNVRGIPEGFDGSQLDDVLCCGDLGDFTITIDDSAAEEGRTYQLFLLAASDLAPTAEPDQDIGSVSVHIRACPAEMTVETLDPEACTAPPPGTSLSLLAGDVPQGVFAVEPELWWWQNLAFGSFSLVVYAIPEGFAASSLGTRVCCDLGRGFEVYTSEETPDTGYILFLYPTPGAAAEVEPQVTDADTATATPEPPLDPFVAVDPDGDGVPTTDEDGFFGTDPDEPDTDGDGINDTAEIAAGTDPLVADAP